MDPRQPTLLSDHDLHLFNEGTLHELWRKLGAHPLRWQGLDGTCFGVWAPNASAVSVVGDFNGWKPEAHPLRSHGHSGIWEGFVPEVGPGALYKYHLTSRQGSAREKADPVAFRSEPAPSTASVVATLDHAWNDDEWMAQRSARARLDAPWSIYEVHLGSWQRDEGRMLSYREIAPRLADHVAHLGFTHVELMPVMEHPFYGSWGYQGTGYFAATGRYGSPQDLMFLIETLHQRGIGVILDWVPSHFAVDEHGLGVFDGTHLYEHGDPRQAIHPEWQSYLFNYGRHEVRSFLVSSALFWIEVFHADALRVDAVASMLYLDYAREPDDWVPNVHGGRENLEAIEFLRQLNTVVYARNPDVQMIAEESTAWPMVSRPAHLGGLGFGLKWDMGWMNDTLRYMEREPVHRRHHQSEISFRSVYAFHENFVLPLSHDEVVHGKGSLLSKMPGDVWQQLANLRLLLGYQYALPGKKLLFMGAELAPWNEWSHEGELDWILRSFPAHNGVEHWLRDLNALYREEPALHQLDCDPKGFEWIDSSDDEQSTLCFLRSGRDGARPFLVVCNFTPVVRHHFRVGVPFPGAWRERLNSDAESYGGSGQGNLGRVESEPTTSHGQPHSLVLTLPPIGVVFMQAEEG